MKVFVFISAAIHFVAFFLMAFVIDIKPSKISLQPLYGSLTHVQRIRTNDSNQWRNVSPTNTLIRPKTEKVPQAKQVLQDIEAANGNESNTSSQTTLQAESYYSSTEVEIVALPTSNLDSSMFSDLFISGIPIKLRLYINAFGHVVKIDRIDLLAQDLLMANRLEELLKQITFLPAKRNGLNVDSYRDIEFSF